MLSAIRLLELIVFVSGFATVLPFYFQGRLRGGKPSINKFGTVSTRFAFATKPAGSKFRRTQHLAEFVEGAASVAALLFDSFLGLRAKLVRNPAGFGDLDDGHTESAALLHRLQ